MTGEFGHKPQESGLSQRDLVRKISKELAVLIWENFLKRYSASFPNIYEATTSLKSDLSQAAADNDQTIPKSLASVDIDRSYQEFCDYLDGKIEPNESHLFLEKRLSRPPDYFGEGTTESEQLGKQISKTKRQLDLQIAELRSMYTDENQHFLARLSDAQFKKWRKNLVDLNAAKDEFEIIIIDIRNGKITSQEAAAKISSIQSLMEKIHQNTKTLKDIMFQL